MQKRIIWGVIAVLVIAGLVVLFLPSGDTTPQEETPWKMDLSGVDFNQIGYLWDREPEIPNQGIFILYEEPGSPALSIQLTFDNQSACTFGERSVPCLGLTPSIEEKIGEERMFVEGIQQGEAVLVRNLALDREAGRRFGFIRNVTENNQNVLVEIDSVEFLSGEEAIQAGIEDTDCTRENITDCIPSLNNDFYIRNLATTTEIYIANGDTKIKTFKNPGSPELEDIPMESLVSKFEDSDSSLTSYPFKFILNGALLTELEEQYIP